MKIRTGFVSNSSSSSFVVYGITMNSSEVLDLAKKLGYETAVSEDEEYIDTYELLKFVAVKLGKDWGSSTGPQGECPMLGRKYQSLKDDETGKQFRDSVQQKLSEMLGKKVNPEHVEEGWMDY